jgi:ABC-type transport system involved in multi-copper enzyme maturation permease subunit
MFGVSFSDWLALVALGVVGLVAAVVAVWLAVGLFGSRSLVRRELMSYFTSPIAYVVLVVFLFVTGYRFWKTLEQLTAVGPEGVEYPMQVMYSILPASQEKMSLVESLSAIAFGMVYLLIPPLLTMRLFAEERSSGTLELLMTAPVRDWQAVLSKYLACFAFYVFLWVPTLVYLPVLLGMGWPVFPWTAPAEAWTPFGIAFVAGVVALVVSLVLALLPGGSGFRLVALILFLVGALAAAVGGWCHYHIDTGPNRPHVLDIPVVLDSWPVVTTYVGLLLTGAMLLAVGLLVSSLVRSQLVSAMVTLVLSLAILSVGIFWPPDPGSQGLMAQTMASLSVPVHMHRDFNRGVIDTRHLTLYVSVTFFCLFLTVRSLESRRWR